MACAFFSLLTFCGLAGYLAWSAGRRLLYHMRHNPEAAKLVAEHVIAPILIGPAAKLDEVERLDVKKPKAKVV